MRFIAIVTAVLSLFACATDRGATPTSPTPPSRSMVRGTVVDFQTVQPIPGVVVGFATDIGFPGAPIGLTETAVTDTDGRYSLPEPPPRGDSPIGYYFVIDNQIVGRGYPRSANYRADLAVDRGKCVTRYGMVLDRRTFAPIAGASVLNLGNRVLATSDRDGWYQVDFGCGVGWVGFNTNWLIMSHPSYTSKNFAFGRGIVGLYREDVVLTPR